MILQRSSYEPTGFVTVPWQPRGRSRDDLRTLKMTARDGYFDRRNMLQTAFVLAGVISSAQVKPPSPANAWCGRMYPTWAYSLSFNEGNFPFQYPTGEPWSGEIFLRVLGDDKKEKKNNVAPIILIPGGPGLPHDYLETLEAAAFSDRRLILFDPIGCGESSKSLPPSLASGEVDAKGWSSFVAAQVKAVADFLELKDHHVFGHGLGAAAALEYSANVLGARASTGDAALPNVKSLTLASPFVVLGPQALSTPYKDKQEVVPVCVDSALRGADPQDFKLSSDLGSGARVEKEFATSPLVRLLGNVPVGVSYGASDIVGPAVIDLLVQELGRGGGQGRVSVKEFSRSGHLAHVDEREEYVEWLMASLDAVDARKVKVKTGNKKFNAGLEVKRK